jgi:hypothetical protein
MATLNSTNVQTGNTVESNDILQLYDAFTSGGGTTGAYSVSISGSLTGLATSASFALTASYATQALSASYAPGAAGATFPYTGSAIITGSLGITGSLSNGTGNISSGDYSHAEGSATTAQGAYSHAEGSGSTASGQYSHAEGRDTIASGQYSHAQGNNTLASNTYAHAEGSITTGSGQYSHAEGNSTTALGNYSHAEGSNTLASGLVSHAEGYAVTASGNYSHAEGASTTASGSFSHAEGALTIASGNYSHAEGYNTVASGLYQHVQGQYNISSSAQSAFIVGNGTGNGALRSNLIFASGSQVQITGSVIATTGFTGSLQGTASFATTSSYAVTASHALNFFPITTQWYTTATNNYNIPSGRDVGILFNYTSTNPQLNLNTSSAQLGDKVMIIVTSSQTYNVTINVDTPARIRVGSSLSSVGGTAVNGADASYWKFICVTTLPTWQLVEYSDSESIPFGSWTVSTT